jgi:SAM-dependent methyltransferase
VDLVSVFEWDVSNWAQATSFWSRHLPADLTGLQALEVGAHNGGLSLWLALQGAQVVCSDLREPVDRGRALHEQFGVGDRIRYEKIDARQIPYRRHFDLVVFKSLLGGIRGSAGEEAPLQVTRSIWEALKPGGKCLFAENLAGCAIHRFTRRHFVPWGNQWKYLAFHEIPLMFDPFDSLDWEARGFSGLFGWTERSRRVLGFLDRVVFDRFLPKDWRYIAIGVSGKSDHRKTGAGATEGVREE